LTLNGILCPNVTALAVHSNQFL